MFQLLKRLGDVPNMKKQITNLHFNYMLLAIILIFWSACTATIKPNYFHDNPDVLNSTYTTEDLAVIKNNFEANPLEYSQELGEALMWQFNQKSPEFAREMAKIHNIADGISPKEVGPLTLINELVESIEIPSDLYTKRVIDPEFKNISVFYKNDSRKTQTLTGLVRGKCNPSFSKLKVPSNDSKQTGQDNVYPKKYSDLTWTRKVPPGNTSSVILHVTHPKNVIISMDINDEFFVFSNDDLPVKEYMKSDKNNRGELVIESLNQYGWTHEQYALHDMVRSGQGKGFSAPLKALLKAYKDGMFKKGDNPFENYTGVIDFIKPLWGDMEGPGWSNINEVSKWVNSEELLNIWINKYITYGKGRIGYTKYAKKTFEDRTGDCSDVVELGTKILGKSGYNVKKVCTPRHVMGYIEKNGLIYVIIDFKKNGNNMHARPYKNKSEIGYVVTCGSGVNP